MFVSASGLVASQQPKPQEIESLSQERIAKATKGKIGSGVADDDAVQRRDLKASGGVKKSDPYDFEFPEGSTIELSDGGTVVDVSRVHLHLDNIFRGGIGYGASASRLMAAAMKDIGHRGTLYSLPFCIGGALDLPEEYCVLHMISPEDREVPVSTVTSLIETSLKKGYTHFPLPIDLDGHASLAVFVISKDSAVLRFYDSLSPADMSYAKRYEKRLVQFIGSLLPDSIKLVTETPEVLHLLHQGGKDSSGCGYYTLRTVLMLKKNKELRELATFSGKPLLNQTHDREIRADLIVRTLLGRGLKNVNTNINPFMAGAHVDHIFKRVERQVPSLVRQLELRVEAAQGTKSDPYDFEFPEGSTIELSDGRTVVDVSRVRVHLDNIFRGGIGYGATASRLMAAAMKDIGHGGTLYSLPFCVEGLLDFLEKHSGFSVISPENRKVPVSVVTSLIETSLEEGYTQFTLPMDLNGHASLVALVISKGNAVLRFYESMSSDDLSYGERYEERLVQFIGSLLPDSIQLVAEPPEVLHFLHQGGKDSAGGGYYTLHAALLLKKNKALRELATFSGKPLMNQTHDREIRADLILRTLLNRGLKNVSTKINPYMVGAHVDHIFKRVEGQVPFLVEQLQSRVVS